MREDFPPLLPQDGSLSHEQHAGQGWQNKYLFYGHPPGERPYCELIGDPVEQPLFADILRYWAEQLGMSVEVRLRHVARDGLRDYVEHSRRDPLWRGCVVTGDLRSAIRPHVSLLARDPDQWPFVDVVFRYELGWPGALMGGASAFWKSLEKLLKDTDSWIWLAAIQIVGSGPDAFSAAAMLCEKKIGNIWIYTGDQEEGRALARRLELGEQRVLPLEALGPVPAAAQTLMGAHAGSPHFLINTTRLGQEGAGDVLIELDRYSDRTFVYDFVYDPRETALIGKARALGIRATNGLPMLIEQAASAFWAFFLKNPSRKSDAELLARLA